MKYETGMLAILVLYKTKLKQSTSFLSLLASIKNNNIRLSLLVYDNSPDFNQDILAEQYENLNVLYQPDPLNGGVGKAYNYGAKLAGSMNLQWLLLLDQDTTFPIHSIDVYLSAIKKYPDEKLFAPIMAVNERKIISPFHYKFMRGFSIKNIKAGINKLNRFSIINCGMCINIDAFNRNGGYNELIKLDFSDHDFIKRYKAIVDEKFVVIDLKIRHELSSETKNSLDGDLIRFAYYLDGAGKIQSNFLQSLYLKINATLRALKLSLQHRNLIFIKHISGHYLKG